MGKYLIDEENFLFPILRQFCFQLTRGKGQQNLEANSNEAYEWGPLSVRGHVEATQGFSASVQWPQRWMTSNAINASRTRTFVQVQLAELDNSGGNEIPYHVIT